MEKAKAAVSNFIGRAGHHDTTVDERVAPGVTKEEIKPTRHEEAREAVDREVHQDHYHTTIQPVQHQEVRPEHHSHTIAPVQNKEFEHGDASQTRQRLESEAAQFKDTSITHDTQHTVGVTPRVEGEYVHHHVHENVQPVIHKEIIQPEVVHTTVPIHEVHRAEAEHHGTSVLPVKNMQEFTGGGGILAGGGHTAHETYEGDPKQYNSALQMDRTDADVNFKAHDGLHDHQRALGSSGTDTTNPGPHSSHIANKLDPRVDNESSRSGFGTTGTGTGTGTGTYPGDNTARTEIDRQDRVDPRVGATDGSSLPSSNEGGKSPCSNGSSAGTGTGVGAAGVAVRADTVEKHHDPSTTETGTEGAMQTTSGPHSSHLANKMDPRVGNYRASQPQGSSNNDRSQATNTTAVGKNNQNTEPSTSNMSDNPDTETRDTAASPAEGKNAAGSAKGQDPGVVDDKGRKLTGTGVPGSHSALFGLTPDGHKESEVDYRSSKPQPAYSGEDSTAASGDGATLTGKSQEAGGSSGDTGSRAPAGSGVQEQLHNPSVTDRGPGGGDSTADMSAEKPGGGTSVAMPSQGTGQVGKDA